MHHGRGRLRTHDAVPVVVELAHRALFERREERDPHGAFGQGTDRVLSPLLQRSWAVRTAASTTSPAGVARHVRWLIVGKVRRTRCRAGRS